MMKKILIFFLLFPGFLYGENDKAYYYKIVTEAWNTKVYEVAIPLLEKAITEFPGEPDFFSNLVYMYEESKSYKKAFDGSQVRQRFVCASSRILRLSIIRREKIR
jgi:hypothetical protein